MVIAPGVLEIDDRWQSRYGDLEFDSVKFPDPKGMIETASQRRISGDCCGSCPSCKRVPQHVQRRDDLGHLVEGGDPPSLVPRSFPWAALVKGLGSAVKVLVDQYGLASWPLGLVVVGGGRFAVWANFDGGETQASSCNRSHE
jgi:hypothetical protein